MFSSRAALFYKETDLSILRTCSNRFLWVCPPGPQAWEGGSHLSSHVAADVIWCLGAASKAVGHATVHVLRTIKVNVQLDVQ